MILKVYLWEAITHPVQCTKAIFKQLKISDHKLLFNEAMYKNLDSKFRLSTIYLYYLKKT